MTDQQNLPTKIPVFPLSNFIFFPKTSVPLNIFEPRYLQMVNDSIKKDHFFGMIQPKKIKKDFKQKNIPLYSIGCLGKIKNFSETEDGRIILIINGICRFKIISEIKTEKMYRIFNVDYSEFNLDLIKKENPKHKNLEKILINFKTFLNKKGYSINWGEIEKQNFGQTIDTLSMISPFTLEEKQTLLETKLIDERIKKLSKITEIYSKDDFGIKTLQ
tara:strand:- start:189 stop:839 length:651 start_codon:yes stop_codon:yes gene_type:complete